MLEIHLNPGLFGFLFPSLPFFSLSLPSHSLSSFSSFFFLSMSFLPSLPFYIFIKLLRVLCLCHSLSPLSLSLLSSINLSISSPSLYLCLLSYFPLMTKFIPTIVTPLLLNVSSVPDIFTPALCLLIALGCHELYHEVIKLMFKHQREKKATIPAFCSTSPFIPSSSFYPPLFSIRIPLLLIFFFYFIPLFVYFSSVSLLRSPF